MSAPDVTVCVAVFNTMPYLTRCLKSLVQQTIGIDRLEIVAVDDGSTDGSGAELDRFADRYPSVVRVIHQENSGGPAQPSNRALEKASGRYVFFIGADDYLGPEALERMVTEADTYGSDVVLGRMVGVHGRYVPTDVFAETNHDLSLYDSELPYALSNTKLFRRELLERHQIRYPDLPVGSDQPFTLAACVHASRISVLGDYDYYFAVKRKDASNITYTSRYAERLRCTAEIMRTVADLIPAGPRRDAVIRRQFGSELFKLLRKDYLALDRAAQEELCEGVGRLADMYLTDGVLARLDLARRVRLGLARHRAVDHLVESIRMNVENRRPPLVKEGDHAYAAYPGFRDPAVPLPDEIFKLADGIAGWITATVAVCSVRWVRDGAGPAAELTLVGTDPAATADALIQVGYGARWQDVVPHATADPEQVLGTVRLSLADMAASASAGASERAIKIQVVYRGVTAHRRANAERRLVCPSRFRLRRGRLLRVSLVTRANGALAVATKPVTMRAVVSKVRRRLLPGGGKK